MRYILPYEHILLYKDVLYGLGVVCAGVNIHDVYDRIGNVLVRDCPCVSVNVSVCMYFGVSESKHIPFTLMEHGFMESFETLFEVYNFFLFFSFDPMVEFHQTALPSPSLLPLPPSPSLPPSSLGGHGSMGL